jgi:hypothetical protein
MWLWFTAVRGGYCYGNESCDQDPAFNLISRGNKRRRVFITVARRRSVVKISVTTSYCIEGDSVDVLSALEGRKETVAVVVSQEINQAVLGLCW